VLSASSNLRRFIRRTRIRRDGQKKLSRAHGRGVRRRGGSAVGCVGGDDGTNTVLSAPEDYEVLRNADLPYPIHGDTLPEATVPDPLGARR